MSQSRMQNNTLPDDTRLTFILPTLGHAAFEVHRQKMWEKGYRLESNIKSHKYFESDGFNVTELFNGKTMYAATFIKR